MKLWDKDFFSNVGIGCLKGSSAGSALATAAALSTGAAVIVSAPVWLPIVGGVSVISGTTVVLWAGCGAVTGAIFSGVKTARELTQKIDEEEVNRKFKEKFN